MFPFLEFCMKTEKSLLEPNKVHTKLPKHAENYISLREYFIQVFLQRFLPSTIKIGAGEVIDFASQKSSIQDIILYRSNYPVFKTSGVNDTYLLESVIATIEIISNNNPIQLSQAFRNSASVKNLKPTKHNISANNSQDYMELKLKTIPKTFIFSFFNSLDQDALIKLYQISKMETLSVVPDGIFIQSDLAIYAQYDPYTRRTAFRTQEPFIHFFQHLYTIIMAEVNPSMLLADINSTINFDFSSYFSELKSQSIKNK